MYTVTWNPGTFGHMLVLIISLEEHGLAVDDVQKLESTHSHWPTENNSFDWKVQMIHAYDRQLLSTKQKILKPYFKDENLKYFQWYRNEVTYLKSNTHFIEELQQRWNHIEPLCDIGYNIDMTDFYINKDNFCANMAKFMNKTKLKDDTIKFIEQRRKHNWQLYQTYLDNVVDTVRCLKERKHKDITHLDNTQVAMVLCEYFHMDVKGKDKFCNHSNHKLPASTTEILSYA